MAKQANEVAINIVARDGASATIKRVEGNVRRLPESFSKAASALSVLEGSMSGVGSSAIQAVGKVSQLGSILAVGGPIGVGIAAISGAVAVGTKIWETYKLESDNVAAAQRSLVPVFAAVTERLQKQRDKVRGLTDDLRTFGATANQRATILSEEELERLEAAGPQVQATIDREKERLAVLEKRLEYADDIMNRDREGARVRTDEMKAIETSINEKKLEISYLEKGAKARLDNIDAIKKEIEARSELELKTFQEEELKLSADVRKRSSEERKRAAEEKKRQREKELRDEQAARNASLRNESEYQRGLSSLVDRFDQQRLEIQLRREKDEEERRRLREEIEKADHERKVGYAQQAADIIGDAFVQVIEGQKSAGAAAAEMGSRLVQTAIREAAAIAAARQLAANSWLPGIGILIGGAAASAMFAAVMSWAGKAGKMARGGMVQGGIPYTDSVPIMAQDGEGFLSRANTATINKLISALNSFQLRAPQLSAPGVGGGSISFSSLVPYTPVEVARARQSIAKITRSR